MATRDSKACEMATFALLEVFANDDTIDPKEMAILRKLAMEDGHIDADEQAVLRRLFRRVRKEQVTPEVWQQICDFRAQYPER